MSAKNTFTVPVTEVINTTKEVPLPAFFRSEHGNFFSAVLNDKTMIHVCTYPTSAAVALHSPTVSHGDVQCSREDFEAACATAQLIIEDNITALSLQPAQALELCASSEVIS